jgi:hypothetical protein
MRIGISSKISKYVIGPKELQESEKGECKKGLMDDIHISRKFLIREKLDKLLSEAECLQRERALEKKINKSGL